MNGEFPPDSALKCPHCGRLLYGITGLAELRVMRDHLRLLHDQAVDMNDVLELRVQWEEAGYRIERPARRPLDE